MTLSASKVQCQCTQFANILWAVYTSFQLFYYLTYKPSFCIRTPLALVNNYMLCKILTRGIEKFSKKRTVQSFPLNPKHLNQKHLTKKDELNCIKKIK